MTNAFLQLVTGLKVFSLKPDEIKQALGLKTEEPLVGHEVRVKVKVEEERPLHEGISESDDDDDDGEKEKEKSDEMKDKEKEEKSDHDDDDHGEKEKEKSDEMKNKKREESEKKVNPVVPVSREVLVSFVDQSHVLFFSEFTPQFFKPGLLYVGQVRE